MGYSEDSKGSISDQVEIVCRSQVRGIGVQGDRVSISGGRREGSLNQGWNRSGEKLKLGFQGRGKNHFFISEIDLFCKYLIFRIVRGSRKGSQWQRKLSLLKQ